MRNGIRSWFVCQSKIREEQRAKYFLQKKGFEVYLPLMEMQRTNKTKDVFVTKPLFPNYLFVRCNEDRDLGYVRWTEGVRKILPESVHPAAVEEQVVESIRALAQRDGIVRKQPLKKHDRVRILSGPFKELMGIFDEWTSDKGRVRVLLRFVNCPASVELHHTLVEKIS